MDKSSIIIDANSMEEALNLGARSLHLSRDEIMVVSSQQLPQGIRRFEVAPRNSNDRNSLDALLSNVESQMQELDSSSFVKGYSKSDLKEKGLLDSENLGIVRSQYTTPRLLGPFEFFPNIDYMECQELKLHDATWLDSTQSVNPCSSEAQLATIKNSKTDEVTRKFIHPSDTGLLVQLGIGESIIMAKIPGRLLVYKNQLLLLPRDIDGCITLANPIQAMLANASITPPYGEGKAATMDDALTLLAKAKVVFGITHASIEQALSKCQRDHVTINSACFARGMPPIHGSDARIEVYFSQDMGCDDFVIMPDGRIDYRKRFVIPMAHTGELLAKVSLPSSGQPGMDVFGNMIAARSGNSLPVFPGEGVKTSDDGREFFATRDGQVIYNTDMLSVLPTYQVLGDVDYHSGNIEFDGNIFVTGSILPGFFVKAKGDILVQGNVESANIEAGRDLIVKGGIVGAGSMPIRTGRNLVAHHLQNASIEVEGNVVIMNSCLHSIVETSGDFTCIEQKGVLLGGSLVCLKGAEVRVLGSDAGATTKVILGQDFLVRKKIKEAQAALDFINAGIQKIETYLTPLLTKISKYPHSSRTIAASENDLGSSQRNDQPTKLAAEPHQSLGKQCQFDFRC